MMTSASDTKDFMLNANVTMTVASSYVLPVTTDSIQATSSRDEETGHFLLRIPFVKTEVNRSVPLTSVGNIMENSPMTHAVNTVVKLPQGQFSDTSECLAFDSYRLLNITQLQEVKPDQGWTCSDKDVLPFKSTVDSEDIGLGEKSMQCENTGNEKADLFQNEGSSKQCSHNTGTQPEAEMKLARNWNSAFNLTENVDNYVQMVPPSDICCLSPAFSNVGAHQQKDLTQVCRTMTANNKSSDFIKIDRCMENIGDSCVGETIVQANIERQDITPSDWHSVSLQNHAGVAVSESGKSSKYASTQKPELGIKRNSKGYLPQVNISLQDIKKGGKFEHLSKKHVTGLIQTASWNYPCDLESYIDCAAPADEDITLYDWCSCKDSDKKEQISKEHFYINSKNSIQLQTVGRIVFYRQELCSFKRGSRLFVSMAQLQTLKLLIKTQKVNSYLRQFPQFEDSMTDNEIGYLKQNRFVPEKTTLRQLITLGFLRWLYKELIKSGKERLYETLATEEFYVKRIGHDCTKNQELFLKKKLHLSALRHRWKKPQTLFIVKNFKGGVYSVVDVGHIVVGGKTLASFRWRTSTYINFFEVTSYLEDFPWENFQVFVQSLNIMLTEAPVEVTEYFCHHGYGGFDSFLSSKWTSLTELRLISCFSVGQMNKTKFLMKNDVLSKLAAGDYVEMFSEDTWKPQD